MTINVEDLSPGGQVLYLVARVFGARVTSGKRTPSENEGVGGREGSAHLTGDAIDVGQDAPALAVQMLGIFGKGGLDPKGTAPHYHFEVAPWTLLLFGAALVGVVRAIR